MQVGKLRYRLLLLLIFIMSFLASAQDKVHFAVISVDNASKLTQVMSWKGTGSPFTPATFSPDGSQLAIALNNTQIVFVSTETLETIKTIDHVETEGDWLNYSTDGTELFLSKRDGAYRLWNVTTGDVIASSSANGFEPLFSPTTDVRKYLLYSYDYHYVSVNDTVTGEELLHVDDVERYALSPDGTLLLTRSADHTVRMWDVQTGEIKFEIQPPKNLVRDNWGGIGFTHDGQIWVNRPQYLDVNNEIRWFSPIQFWDVESETMVLQLDGPYAYVSDMIFDPAQRFILTTGLGMQSIPIERCWMWDLTLQEQIICHAPGEANFAFSLDGTMIAYNDGTIPNTYVREVSVGQPVFAVLNTPPSWFIKFSPDGRFLLTIDQEVRLWGIPTD